MSISQTEFNQFVKLFNNNYLDLLHRASEGNFDERLVRSFTWLRDTYDVILRLHDLGDVEYAISLYPLSFDGNYELLRAWGFDEAQIDQIMSFLLYFREQSGHDLNDAMPGAVPNGVGGETN